MNGPHRLIDLNAWSPGNGTIRRSGLVGVAVALLAEVCHWGWVLRFQMLKSGPVSLFLLPADTDVALLAPSPAPCLLTHNHASHHEDHGLTL